MRKLLLRITVMLLVTTLLVLSLEGGANLWIKWKATGLPPPVSEVSHCEYDPELGWRHVSNKQVPHLYGPGVGLKTNGQHMRADRDYTVAKAEGIYRIVCLGDSFTMGYGVRDDETFPAQIAQQSPSLETINMGLGGYGIDQCYLWYRRDGAKFESDVLLFSFIVGDFFRMNPIGNVANVPKPVMQLVNGDPVAVNVPVTNILEPTFGRRLRDLWHTSSLAQMLPTTLAAPAMAPGTIDQQQFAPVALRIFEVLRDESQKRGQKFVLAFLPVFEEVAPARCELVDGWLRPALEQRGIAFLDLRPAFRALSKDARSGGRIGRNRPAANGKASG